MRSTAKISPVRENVKKTNSDKLTLSLGRVSLLITGIYTINRSKPILIVVLSLHAQASWFT